MATDRVQRLREAIRDIPDFPKPGIIFKDITPLLASPSLFCDSVDLLAESCANEGVQRIVGIDARGFLFGAAVAYKLGTGFVPVRKKGKLPFKTESISYALEYGESIVEMHVDGIQKGERVVLIDDLLATGGTAAAAIKLIEKMGGELAKALFLVELEFLNGRKALNGVPIQTFLRF